MSRTLLRQMPEWKSLGTGSAWTQVVFGRCLLKLTGQAVTTEACRRSGEIVDRPVSLGNVLSILGRGFVSTAGCGVSGIALRAMAFSRSGSSARLLLPPPQWALPTSF